MYLAPLNYNSLKKFSIPALIQCIVDEINTSGGEISFRRFMEMALYAPSLGYYVAGSRKIGADGDFVTAPEISPLFSQCLAEQCVQVMRELGEDSCLLELGAGSGIMAADILLELACQHTLPAQYLIFELSPDLKQRQYETLKKQIPHLLYLVKWLNQLPTIPFKGIILANEVLDAMPVEVFIQEQNNIFQQTVKWQNDQFQFSQRQATTKLRQTVEKLSILSNTTYTSELNPAIQYWLKLLQQVLAQGVMLLIDYGYPQREYYHPDRNTGTLICHYQHKVHANPLCYVGLQDITANVNFTAVANAANDCNLAVLGYSSQANFLIANGLEKYFMRVLNQQPHKQYHLAQQVRTLTLPSEMGERFKVIALGKKITISLNGFKLLNHRNRL